MRAALLFLAASTPALAQEAPPTSFPGAPINARSLDSEALQRLGVVLPDTEIGRVPNLVATVTPGGGSSRIYLRGIGTADPLDSAAVVTVVDGVPLPLGVGNSFGLFDVEKLSVATGPFGTASGPQALGGVIGIRNKGVGEKVGGFVEAGFGSQARWLLRGSADLPFNEMLGFKVSAYWQGDHGFAHNQTTGERTNDGDMAGIRVAAALRPLDSLSWDVAVAYTEDNSENLLNFDCGDAGIDGCGRYLTTGMPVARRLGGGPQYSVPVSGDKARQGLGSEVKTMLVSSRLAWTGETISVLAVTGYVDTQARQGLDFSDGRGIPTSSLPVPPVRGFENGGRTLLLDGTYRQFSQEVRATATVGALSLTAGGWFADRTDTSDMGDLQTLENGTATGVPLLLADRITRVGTRELAGFIEAAFSQGPFDASAGVRYTDLRQTLSATGTVNLPGQESSIGIWTPSARIAFHPTENIRLFASAARGFRPGGYNIRATTSAGLVPFSTTRGWTFEGGVEAAFANLFTAKLTGFYLNADDVRTTDWFGTPTPAADLRNKGVELELTARPIDHLGLWGNLGVQDAAYRNGPAVDPVQAPSVTASAGAFYDFAIPYAGIVLTPTAEIRYRGEMETTLANTPGTRVESAFLVNASLAVRTDDDDWTLAIECRNCANSDTADNSLYGWTYLTTPRTWMLRARRNF